jgi:hypothetical protein
MNEALQVSTKIFNSHMLLALSKALVKCISVHMEFFEAIFQYNTRIERKNGHAVNRYRYTIAVPCFETFDWKWQQRGNH